MSVDAAHFCLCKNPINRLLSINRELKQPRRRRQGRRLVKNEFIFYQRNSRLSRSVRYANGSKSVLRLKMQ